MTDKQKIFELEQMIELLESSNKRLMGSVNNNLFPFDFSRRTKLLAEMHLNNKEIFENKTEIIKILWVNDKP